MKTGAIFSLSILISVAVLCGLAKPAAAQETGPVITQLQLAGVGSGTASQEYIEVSNHSAIDTDVTGWCLYYASATNSGLGTKLACTETSVITQRILLAAGGSWAIATSEFQEHAPDIQVDGSYDASLSAAGGHIKLTDADGEVMDAVGWGTAQFAEGTAVSTPPAGSTLQRKTVASNFVDTNNNAADFLSMPFSEALPSGLYEAVDMCLNDHDFPGLQAAAPNGYMSNESGECYPIEPEMSCEKVEISEILPNPSGEDTGKEFLEFYNAAEAAVDLSSCELYVNQSKVTLKGSVQPRSYHAFYEVSLPNASGADVMVVSGTVDQRISYPGALKDDEAWSRINGAWQKTNQPTPGEANKPNLVSSSGAVKDSDLAPCPPGKFRNPETNRCKSFGTSGSTLTPCLPGQFRNPDTNRCRKIATVTSTLQPCDAGQYRNPATNRCKSITSSTSLLKPCDEGEERNPETNRCRKITGVAGAASAINPAVANGGSAQNYRVLGIALLLALTYGIYEYRHSIAQRFSALKQKLLRK